MTTLLIPGAMDPINKVFILSGKAPPTTMAPPGAAAFAAAEGGGVGTYPEGPPILKGGGAADPIAPGGGIMPPGPGAGGPPGGPYPGGPALGGGGIL